jgi:hypothetical protein
VVGQHRANREQQVNMYLSHLKAQSEMNSSASRRLEG